MSPNVLVYLCHGGTHSLCSQPVCGCWLGRCWRVGRGKKVFTSVWTSSETLRCVNASFLLHASSLAGSAWGFPGVEGKKLKLPLAVGLSHGAGTTELPWHVLVPQLVRVSSSQPAAGSRRAMAPCPSSQAWVG